MPLVYQVREILSSEYETVIEPLLIAGYDKIFHWDGQGLDVLLETQGRAGGLTWSDEHLYVVDGYSIVAYDADLWLGGLRTLERDPDPQIHQLYWWGGTLYAVLSGTHAVGWWREWEQGRIEWPGRYCEKGDDPRMNSIWCDGDRFYVVEHWRDELPKVIRTFDLGWHPHDVVHVGAEAFDVRWNGLHNVYAEAGALYTLGPQRILRITGPSTRITQMSPRHYLRGLARTDKAFYVGLSLYRPAREDRTSGDGMVWALDDNLQKVDELVIPGAGQIHEVRALVGDRAHNGLQCPIRF